MIKYLRYFYYLFYRPKIFFSKKSYSLLGEDVFLNKYFLKQKEGFYVDVGCYHPISGNNTYLLYKKGWNGINVDSDEKSISEFKRFRGDDHNINSLISGSRKKIKYYFYHDRSALNTVDSKLVRQRKTKPKKIIKMKTTTLNEILEQSPYKNKKINLLSIDIENHEYEVLKNFNFKKYKIDMIVTECLNLKLRKLETQNQTLEFILKSNIYKLLKKNNYKLINWVNSDLIFFNKNSKI